MMTTPPPPEREATRRDRRIQRQRQAIVDAAAELFAQKGYEATTTKDIARAADIGESTLYGYFASKQEVLQAILSQQAEMVDSLLEHLGEMTGLESFVDLTDVLMEKILSRTLYNRVLIAEAWVDDQVLRSFVFTHWAPIMENLQDFIRGRIADGVFRPIDPGLGARMLVAAFIAALLPVLRGVEPPPSPEQRRALASAVVEIITGGFTAQKG